MKIIRENYKDFIAVFVIGFLADEILYGIHPFSSIIFGLVAVSVFHAVLWISYKVFPKKL